MAALGPLWGGFAYDHILPGSPYLISAVIIALACVLLVQFKVKAKTASSFSQPSPAD